MVALRNVFKRLVEVFFSLSFILAPICGTAFFFDDWYDVDSLYEAAAAGKAGNIERLIRKGALLEERNDQGLTPLLYAVEIAASEDAALALIQGGADLEACDEAGRTPLLLCCSLADAKDRAPLLKLLLAQGADAQARDNEGNTPLIAAAANGHADAAGRLIQAGVDLEAANNADKTALMSAAESNRLKIVSHLLAGGAKADARDPKGMTPLMYASYKGHVAVLKMLLQNGADVNAQTRESVVVEFTTKERGKPLPYPTASKEVTVPSGSTALTFAQLSGGKGAIKVLLEFLAAADPSMEQSLLELKREWHKI